MDGEVLKGTEDRVVTLTRNRFIAYLYKTVL